MKKKINRRLTVALLMSFVIYMMFGQVTQLLQLLKAVERESEIMTGQLAKIAEQMGLSGSEDETVWNGLLSFAQLDEDSKMLIADASTNQVIGTTAAELS